MENQSGQFLQQVLDFIKDGGFALILSAFVIVAASTFFNAIRTGVKLSLRIAVIGLPRSGKTTLITSVFDTIMSGRIAKYVSVSGTETVDRVTRYLGALKKGINISPTTDKDVFAYRYTYVRKILSLFPIKYDVEIADFPGEYSKDLSEDILTRTTGEGMFKKEFFNWIVRADRYIFVIDAEPYWIYKSSGDPNTLRAYISEVEVSFKNAVLTLKQELLDENVHKRNLLVVFSKCDVFFIDEDDVSIKYENGYSQIDIIYRDKRVEDAIKNDEIASTGAKGVKEMLNDFSDLTHFFNNNFRRVVVLPHSSYSNSGPFEGSNRRIVAFSSPP